MSSAHLVAVAAIELEERANVLYSLFLNPVLATKWLAPPGGIQRLTLDPQPFGLIRMSMQEEGRWDHYQGRFLRLIHGHEMVINLRRQDQFQWDLIKARFDEHGSFTRVQICHQLARGSSDLQHSTAARWQQSLHSFSRLVRIRWAKVS